MKNKIQTETRIPRLEGPFFPRALAAVLLLAVPLLTSCGGGGNSAPPPPPPLPAVAVVISPNTVTLPAGGAQTFTVTVEGSANTAVTWSVQEGAAGGTITSLGVYTAPPAPGTYHVVAATAAVNPTRATATRPKGRRMLPTLPKIGAGIRQPKGETPCLTEESFSLSQSALSQRL